MFFHLCQILWQNSSLIFREFSFRNKRHQIWKHAHWMELHRGHRMKMASYFLGAHWTLGKAAFSLPPLSVLGQVVKDWRTRQMAFSLTGITFLFSWLITPSVSGAFSCNTCVSCVRTLPSITLKCESLLLLFCAGSPLSTGQAAF